MSKKTIFVSFDYDNDSHYKNLLVAWDKNALFDFKFYDGSLKTAINSVNATYIKSRITPLIQKASHLLCIVGTESGNNSWIAWEVQTAASFGKKLIGVKLQKSNVSPPALLNNNATWAMSFTFDAVKNAIDEA